MPVTTPTIPSTVRHLLEDTRKLIHTHGHDNGVKMEGRVPLTLVGAMKLALDHSPLRPSFTLSHRSQVLIDAAFSHLQGEFESDRHPWVKIMTFRRFLRAAPTVMMVELLDDTLAGDV